MLRGVGKPSPVTSRSERQELLGSQGGPDLSAPWEIGWPKGSKQLCGILRGATISLLLALCMDHVGLLGKFEVGVGGTWPSHL